MKIHAKALLIFAIAVTLMFSIVLWLSVEISLAMYQDLERQDIVQETKRAALDLQARVEPVSAAMGDWGPWDELHAFMRGKNPGFIETNLNAPALENLRLDFMLFAGTDGRLVAGEMLDGEPGEMKPVSREIFEAVRAGGYVPQNQIGQHTDGMLLIGTRICLVSAYPILTSAHSGPVAGTVVGGSFLSAASLHRLELFSNHTVKLLYPTEEDGEWKALQAELLDTRTPVVRVESPEKISAYLLQRDRQEDPLFAVKLTGPRSIYKAGKRTIRVFVSALTLAGGILFFLGWYGLDHTVLSPIRSLTQKVESAAEEGRLPVGIGTEGKDEISVLSREVEALAHSLERAQARYSIIVETQSSLICRYKADGRLSFVNHAFCVFIKHPREELLGTDVSDLFPESNGAPSARGRLKLAPASPVATGEDRFVSEDGEVYWLGREDHGTFDSKGRLLEVQTVFSDITASHLAHLQVEESEIRYRNLFENATDGILIIDEEIGTVCDVNLSLCRMLGYEKAVLLGQHVESLVFLSRVEDLSALRNGDHADREVVQLRAVGLRRSDNRQVFCDIVIASYKAGTRALEQWNFRDITDRKKMDDDLRQLSGQLLTLQDQERRRIARELHDSTAQVLTAVQMNLSILNTVYEGSNPAAQRVLQETRGMVDQCNSEIRTISYLLHPPLLDEVGLVFAIKWFVDGFSKRTGTRVSVVAPETLPRLPSDIETTLFRVVQEALTNVHRHSGGTCAWICIERTADGLMLEVRDNGRGISAEQQVHLDEFVPSLGVGLRGMRERLAQFHGDLKISSDPAGTRVRANVKLNWGNLCLGLKS